MRRRHGFTLIELMVALALVALALGFGLSTLRDVISNNRIRSTAQQVLDAVQLARSEAVKRNVPVELRVSDSAATLNFLAGSSCVPASCRTLTFGTSSGLSVLADAATTTALVFNASGQLADAGNHVVDVTNGRCSTEQSCLRVQVRGGGSVRICNPAQGDASAANVCA